MYSGNLLRSRALRERRVESVVSRQSAMRRGDMRSPEQIQ